MSAFVCSDETFNLVSIFAAQGHPRPQDRQRTIRYDVARILCDRPELLSGHVYSFEPGHVTTWADFVEYGTEKDCAYVIADALKMENYRSVAFRYRGDVAMLASPDRVTMTAADWRRAETVTPATVLKQLDCIEYQSCETPDYETAPAYRLLQMIRSLAIRQVPGYEDAPWGVVPHREQVSA